MRVTAQGDRRRDFRDEPPRGRDDRGGYDRGAPPRDERGGFDERGPPRGDRGGFDERGPPPRRDDTVRLNTCKIITRAPHGTTPPLLHTFAFDDVHSSSPSGS